MAPQFSPVYVSKAGRNGELIPKFDTAVLLCIDYDPQGFSVKLKRGLFYFTIS